MIRAFSDAIGAGSGYSNIRAALPETIVDVASVAPLPLVRPTLPLETPLTAEPLTGSFSPSAPVAVGAASLSMAAATGALAAVNAPKTLPPIVIGGLVAVSIFAGWIVFRKKG